MTPKNEKPFDEGAAMVGSEQLARLLDISPAFLRKLTQDGKISKQSRGKYHLADTIRGYVRFLREGNARSTKTAHLARMQDAKTTEIEMRLAEKRRELIPIEDCNFALDTLVAKIRDEFGGLPARFTRDMPIRRKLQDEVNQGFNRVANELAAVAKLAREGGELPGHADD